MRKIHHYLISTALSLLVATYSYSAAYAEPPSSTAKILAELNAPSGSLCEQLEKFLQHGSEFDMPTFVFDKVSFGAGSTKIQPGSEAELQSLAELLLAYPDVRITLRGQTDSTGDSDMNKELSLRRAESVKDALIDQDVAEGRMRVQGIGPDDPLAPGAVVNGRQANRRTELQVTYH